MTLPYRYCFTVAALLAASVAANATPPALPPAVATGMQQALPVITVQEGEEVETRLGTLSVVDHPTGMRTLGLNGMPLFDELDADLLGFHALIRMPSHDMVLAWADCSGSSCGTPTYYLVELHEEEGASLLTADGFAGGEVANPTDENMRPTLRVQADGGVLIETVGDEKARFFIARGH
jgi:hypothetical protein